MPWYKRSWGTGYWKKTTGFAAANELAFHLLPRTQMPSARTGSGLPQHSTAHEVAVPSLCYSCILADLLLTSLQQNTPSPNPVAEQPRVTKNRLFCSFLNLLAMKHTHLTLHSLCLIWHRRSGTSNTWH